MPHVILTVLLGTVSTYGRRLAMGVPIWWLIAFQAFRIPLEMLLHQFYREGIAPVQMMYLGRNFDIPSGLTAIPVAWIAMRGKAPKMLILLWNCLGLALLANIVGVVATSVPGPLRLFWNERSAGFIGEFPYVLVPTVFVTSALFGPLLVFRRLRNDPVLATSAR